MRSWSLHFLPAKSQASLAHLGDIVDTKLSKLKSDSELKITRFRQAVYIHFIKRNHIPNPCHSKPGYEQIIACFIEQLMLDHNSWSAIVRGYVEAINILFQLCHFNISADLSDHANMCSKIILAREREENIARQRSPITREMYSTMLDLANKPPINSLETAVADWFTLIRITGLRCAEYAQKIQSAIDEHEYTSSKCAVKAFVPTDWTFHNSKGSLI